MNILKSVIYKREATVSFFLIGIFILVGIVNPDFLTLTSIDLISQNSILYIFLATGMTFVLLTGNIDVSVGGILGLCGAIIATLVRDGANPFFSLLKPCEQNIFQQKQYFRYSFLPKAKVQP